MGLTYIKLFVDYLDAIEPLGDAERGRLLTALLEYGRTGEAPQLSGNERFLFPMIKAQMDRDAAMYESERQYISDTRSAAGKKGAQAKQANASKSKQTLANQAKEKDKDKDKDEDKDESIMRSAPTRARFVPPSLEEVTAYCQERGNQINPQSFLDYYTANGWVQGKNRPIKDWKACVRTWEARETTQRTNTGHVTTSGVKPGQSAGEGDLDAYEKQAILDLQERMKNQREG